MSKTKKLTAMLLCVCLLLLFPASVLAETIQVQPIGGSPYFQTERQLAQYPDAVGKYFLLNNRLHYDKNYFGTEEHTPFYNVPITTYYPTDTAIYYVEVNGTSIKKLNTNTMESVVLYQGTEEIHQIKGDDEILFFMEGNRLSRIHIPSLTKEVILAVPSMETFITYGVHSTRYVHLYGCLPDKENSVLRVDCNLSTVEAISPEDDEVYTREQFIQLQQEWRPTEIQSTNIYVNIKISPKIENLRNEYIGRAYPMNDGNGHWTCVAFAFAVSNAIYGKNYPHGRVFFDGRSGSDYQAHHFVTMTTEMAKSLPDGARVRVDGDNYTDEETNILYANTNTGHTLSVVGKTAQTITVFESNWSCNGQNIVTLTEMTYDQFIQRYHYKVSYYDHPSAVANHTHSNNLHYQYNDATHLRICGTCYATAYLAHNFSSQIYTEDGMDYHYCTDCWYKDKA